MSSLGSSNQNALAQDTTNLLINGSLERPYYGQGASTRTVPQNWNLWIGTGAPEAFPHTDRVQVLDGEVSWNIKQGYAVFAAAGYQRVSGLTVGDALRFSASGWVYTCNDTQNSCIIPDPPYRRSDTAAGVSLKVGIDTKGGTDPNAASVKWSSVAAPYDQWVEMSITATAEADAVTVFMYATQTAPLAMNNVYWDRAALVRTTAAPAVEPTAAFVPFVAPQSVKPDGSIIHVVQAGDTLSSIAYAYTEYGVTNESIAALNPPMKPNTRVLQLGQEVIILPPGSVDPATGKLKQPGATTAAQNPTPETAPAGSTPIPTPTIDAAEGGTTAEPTATPAEGNQTAAEVSYASVRAGFLTNERGLMLWLEDVDQIYVLINGGTAQEGNYSAYRDTWQEGMPETDPALQAPAGLFQPTQSFGQAWRTYPGVRDALGWGTAEAVNFTALIVRSGNNIVVNGPDKRVYELSENGAWKAVDYFAQP
ncbi:MAG: LysM peptidoglycan-binding domain-containing protein [Chloroflexi bacterium]|nr:LysM peptidoglycan-binding domain-containing protein [Chloroflexota bacterium]